MKIWWILVVLPTYLEAHPCCPGENIVMRSTHDCINNQTIPFTCDGAIVSADKEVLEALQLSLINGTIISADPDISIRYCQAKLYPPDPDESLNTLSLLCYSKNIEEAHQVISQEDRLHLTAVLGSISLVFLVLTIAIYSIVPNLLDLQNICMMHVMVGLAVGFFFLIVLQFLEMGGTVCEMSGFSMYYALIYSFFWLTILSFHIWRTTVNPAFSRRISKWSHIYHAFGITGPVLLLTILILAHHTDWSIWGDMRPGIGSASCWFESKLKTMVYFYGPISLLLIPNVVFYIWTIVHLSKAPNPDGKNKLLRYRFKISVRLCIISGIPWILEVLTFVLEYRVPKAGKVLFLMIDIINGCQGLLIFLVLAVFRKKVRRSLASKNPCNVKCPRSWTYLKDEEIGEEEQEPGETIVLNSGNLNHSSQ